MTGGLLYVMGPSGSGKDSLLRALAERLGPHDRVVIAHRYITRTSDGHEASVPLSEEEFARRSALGCFALQWASHGLRYGIGIEIDEWMARGLTVVVNGSREHLPDAHARYPTLGAVNVTVGSDVLARRLHARGREDETAVMARLARAARPFAVPDGCRLAMLDNSGPLEVGAAMLHELVQPALAGWDADADAVTVS